MPFSLFCSGFIFFTHSPSTILDLWTLFRTYKCWYNDPLMLLFSFHSISDSVMERFFFGHNFENQLFSGIWLIYNACFFFNFFGSALSVLFDEWLCLCETEVLSGSQPTTTVDPYSYPGPNTLWVQILIMPQKCKENFLKD